MELNKYIYMCPLSFQLYSKVKEHTLTLKQTEQYICIHIQHKMHACMYNHGVNVYVYRVCRVCRRFLVFPLSVHECVCGVLVYIYIYIYIYIHRITHRARARPRDPPRALVSIFDGADPLPAGQIQQLYTTTRRRPPNPPATIFCFIMFNTERTHDKEHTYKIK